MPNNSTLSTLFDQTPALQLLREIAVVAHQSLAIEKKRVLHLINYVTPRNSRLTNYVADINNMHFQAEEIIRVHSSNNPNSREDRPLVKDQDGKFYPKIPGTDYVSCFAEGFRGWFGCGSNAHQFRACPDRNTLEVKRKFYLDINAHVPSTRLRRTTTPAENNAVQSNSLLANFSSNTNPSSSISNPILKRARFCPIIFHMQQRNPYLFQSIILYFQLISTLD